MTKRTPNQTKHVERQDQLWDALQRLAFPKSSGATAMDAPKLTPSDFPELIAAVAAVTIPAMGEVDGRTEASAFVESCIDLCAYWRMVEFERLKALLVAGGVHDQAARLARTMNVSPSPIVAAERDRLKALHVFATDQAAALEQSVRRPNQKAGSTRGHPIAFHTGLTWLLAAKFHDLGLEQPEVHIKRLLIRHGMAPSPETIRKLSRHAQPERRAAEAAKVAIVKASLKRN